MFHVARFIGGVGVVLIVLGLALALETLLFHGAHSMVPAADLGLVGLPGISSTPLVAVATTALGLLMARVVPKHIRGW